MHCKLSPTRHSQTSCLYGMQCVGCDAQLFRLFIFHLNSTCVAVCIRFHNKGMKNITTRTSISVPPSHKHCGAHQRQKFLQVLSEWMALKWAARQRKLRVTKKKIHYSKMTFTYHRFRGMTGDKAMSNQMQLYFNIISTTFSCYDDTL